MLWLVVLALGCGRLSSCAGDTAKDEVAQAPSAPVPVVEPVAPVAPAGPTWLWAAVVRVEPGLAEAEEVELTTASGQPLAEPGMPGDDPLADDVAAPDSPEALAEVEAALAGQPLTLWRAPAGASLTVPPARGEGEPVDVDVPADAAPGWLVFTDAGLHRLEWGDAARVQELEVALGLEAWRIVLDAGGSQTMGPAAEHADLGHRFADAGVRLVVVDRDAVVPVPFSDDAAQQVDVAATLAAAGVDRGFILVAAGKDPLVLEDVSPFLVMRKAGGYFGVDVRPAPRQAALGQQRRGRGGQGAAGSGKGGKGRGRFMRGKGGKAGRFGPGMRGHGGPRGGRGGPPALTGSDGGGSTGSTPDNTTDGGSTGSSDE